MAKRTTSETLQVEYSPSEKKRIASLVLQVEEVPFDNRITDSALLMVEYVVDPTIQAYLSLNATLDGATATGEAKAFASGMVSQTLESASVSSSVMIGANVVSGGVNVSLEDVVFSSGAALPLKGNLANTLDDATFDSTGVAVASGRLSKILADLTGRITGLVGVKGTLSKTLDILGLASTIQAKGNDFVLNVNLEDANISSAGIVAANGHLSNALGDSTLLSQAIASIGGSLQNQLASSALESAGRVTVVGNFERILEGVGISSEGIVWKPFDIICLRVYVQSLLQQNIQIRRVEKLNVFTQSIYKSNSHF